MKRNLLLLIALFFFKNGMAQTDCTPVFDYEIPALADCRYPIRNEIYLFNKMAAHFGIKDTMKYECIDDKVVYSYKGKMIANWKYNAKSCGEKLMLKGYNNAMGTKLLATIPTGKGNALVYELIISKKEKNRLIFKTYKEKGMLPYGKYIEKNCAGQVVVKGKYGFVKTNENKEKSIRIKTWKYYNAKGKLVKKEKYSKSKSNFNNSAVEGCTDIELNMEWDYYREKQLSPPIRLYNKVNAMLGRKIYLTYDITHRGIIYYQNGQMIPAPFFNNTTGRYKAFDYQMQHHGGNLLLEYKSDNLSVYIPTGHGEGEFIKYVYNDHSPSDSYLNKYQIKNFRHSGLYEKVNCTGNVLAKGSYNTIDTTFSIMKEVINPNSYQVEMIETEYDKLTVKNGKWTYFDSHGNQIMEENYPGLLNGSLLSDFLCIELKDEFYTLRNDINNDFLFFNSLCKQFGIDIWLNWFARKNKEECYLNGSKVDAPKVSYLKNNGDVFKIKSPDISIGITTFSNNQAALGKLEDKLKVSLFATIKYKDGKGETLHLQKRKLVRSQTLDGVKNGIYEQRNCDGTLLVSGQYCQIDFYHRDTVTFFNPETYEETVQVIESNVLEKEYGIWKYFTADGKLEKEVDFGDCK